MSVPRIAPFGRWESPITTDLIVSAVIGLGDPRPDGQNLTWLETRPTEGGRTVIVRRTPDGKTIDLIDAPASASRRHFETVLDALGRVAGEFGYAVEDSTISRIADLVRSLPHTPAAEWTLSDEVSM